MQRAEGKNELKTIIVKIGLLHKRMWWILRGIIGNK